MTKNDFDSAFSKHFPIAIAMVSKMRFELKNLVDFGG